MHEDIKVYVVNYPNRANFIMRYTCPITGKQVQRSSGVPDRQTAIKKAAVWEAELREGRYKPASRKTWEEFREKYETEVVPGLAEATALKVNTVFEAVERILNPKRVRDITADRLSYFVSQLRCEKVKVRRRVKGRMVTRTETKRRQESSIESMLAHLKSALTKAAKWEYITARPEMPELHRAKGSRSKGRPVTADEFDRMIDATALVVGQDAAPDWEYFLRGLWWSGLRLDEAINLRWDESTAETLVVDMSGRRPVFAVPAEAEKGHKDRTLPMAPEFAEMLMAAPEAERTGRVFRLPDPKGGRYIERKDTISKLVCRIGQRACVVVNAKLEKCASAQDLRRSFGDRWSHRVMPAVLRTLMRHESLSTTEKFYLGQNAEVTADVLWDAVSKARGAS